MLPAYGRCQIKKLLLLLGRFRHHGIRELFQLEMTSKI